MSYRKNFIILLFPLLFAVFAAEVKAQGASDVLRYSLQYPSYDPVSVVMPGVTHPTGFGAYQENPAVMALFDKGFISFGLSNRSVNEESLYLGNNSEFDDAQTNIGDFGLAYKVPVARGSLVIGGGYSQSTDYNRALSVNARNNRSTITDFYKSSSDLVDDSLFFAAFDAFAIDDTTNDGVINNPASIFRIVVPEYRGIQQTMEMIERGVMGEYSAFIATEFQKNLLIGLSIGLINGNYSFDRSFLETDNRDDYSGPDIDMDLDGQFETNIDNILSKDVIDANFTAFSARIGFVYQATPNINLGGSYQFRNTLSIDEDFNTIITTTFDNGQTLSFDAPGFFSYKITRPARINVGAAIKNMDGFTVSASAEGVRYSSGRIEFEGIRSTNDEDAVNNVIESDLEDVVNLRAGIEYNFQDVFKPRMGFAYFPSPQQNIDASRQFVNGGFSAQIFDNVTFDLGVQYSFWEDQNTLYSYEVAPGGEVLSETAGEDVTRWHIMGGITIGL